MDMVVRLSKTIPIKDAAWTSTGLFNFLQTLSLLERRSSFCPELPTRRDSFLLNWGIETAMWSTYQVMLHLPNQTDHIITDLVNKAMTVMFGNDCSSNLETLRYNTLVKKNYNSQVLCSPWTFAIYIVLYQIPLPQSLLPNYGLHGYWWWYGCSRVGMESRQ